MSFCCTTRNVVITYYAIFTLNTGPYPRGFWRFWRTPTHVKMSIFYRKGPLNLLKQIYIAITVLHVSILVFVFLEFTKLLTVWAIRFAICKCKKVGLPCNLPFGILIPRHSNWNHQMEHFLLSYMTICPLQGFSQ